MYCILICIFQPFIRHENKRKEHSHSVKILNSCFHSFIELVVIPVFHMGFQYIVCNLTIKFEYLCCIYYYLFICLSHIAALHKQNTHILCCMKKKMKFTFIHMPKWHDFRWKTLQYWKFSLTASLCCIRVILRFQKFFFCALSICLFEESFTSLETQETKCILICDNKTTQHSFYCFPFLWKFLFFLNSYFFFYCS